MNFKRLEVKKLGIGSVFKVILYIMIIPAGICFLIGAIISMISLAMQEYEMLIMGIVMMIAYPLIFIGVYGGMGALMSLLYNVLSNKFGGLEITVQDMDSVEEKDLQV